MVISKIKIENFTNSNKENSRVRFGELGTVWGTLPSQ